MFCSRFNVLHYVIFSCSICYSYLVNTCTDFDIVIYDSLGDLGWGESLGDEMDQENVHGPAIVDGNRRHVFVFAGGSRSELRDMQLAAKATLERLIIIIIIIISSTNNKGSRK